MSGISNLSSVGASLFTTGAAPNPVAPASASASTSSNKLTTYQAEYLNLQQADSQELLYASFLPADQALANADSVLGQAAQLLGTPGSTTPADAAAAATTAPAASSSSSSSASSSLDNLPSVASILAASDQQAQATLTAYANAPVGSSILDYQA
jgi:hypothetical protein